MRPVIQPRTIRADRLGDDVVAVIAALAIRKPVLAGHSIGGAEMSSVANRYPGRVAGLVYLDSVDSYAFDNGKGTDAREAQALRPPQPPPPAPADLASFAALQKIFDAWTGSRPLKRNGGSNGNRTPPEELSGRGITRAPRPWAPCS